MGFSSCLTVHCTSLAFLVLVACQTRVFNSGAGNQSGQKSLESSVRKDKSGRKVVDRFYLANQYSTEKIGEGPELFGDALIYGVACFNEDANPGATVSLPNEPLADPNAHVVFREKPLKERSYVHEFDPFFPDFSNSSTEKLIEKKNTLGDAKSTRPKDATGCKVIFGPQKLSWGVHLATSNQDLLEKVLFEKVSATAGTCTNFVAGSLAMMGMSVAGAAAILPATIPAAISSSGLLGVFGGALSCKPAISSFRRDVAEFKFKSSENIFNEAWNAANDRALLKLESSPKKARFESAVAEKNYMLAAAIFNPEFVKAYNLELNHTIEKRGGWFNWVQTLSADDFFEYVNHLEREVGWAYSKALQE